VCGGDTFRRPSCIRMHGHREFVTVTMMRALLLTCATAGLLALASAGAGAQTAAGSNTAASCPRGALKIYFASGDVTASPQAQALIGKIGDTATSCEPDHVDIVARFDPNMDGDRAVTVALERLSTVVADLVSRGLSVDRIRISARAVKAGEYPPGHLNQVDVLFRKAAETGEAQEMEPAPAAPVGAFRSEAI
jgi:hypothetical protein